MSSEEIDNEDENDGNDLRGVPEWQINLMILFFNILFFPLVKLQDFISNVDKEEKEDIEK